MECHGQNSASGCNVIREVFVKKNLLPEVLVCIWQFEAFLFIFLPLPVNCSNLLFGEILLMFVMQKLLIHYFSLLFVHLHLSSQRVLITKQS